MNSFGTILNECFEKLEITQSNAANMIGCSRAMIYSVLGGEKNLTESKFQHMLSVIPFSDEQISQLRYAYYKDKYPSGVIDRILLISHYMSGRYKNKSSVTVPPVPIPAVSGAVMGEWELLGIAAALTEDKKASVITTNYPFEHKSFDDTVFAALTSRTTKADFRHIIEFEKDNSSDKNISNLFLSIRYIRRNYNPRYCYSDITKDGECNNIYPYYLITDRYALFFNLKMNCGMFITDSSIVHSSNEMAKVLLEQCLPLSSYPTDVFELKSTITKVSANKISAAFGNSACIIPFMPEIVKNIAVEDIPNKDVLIRIAIDHYTRIGQHSGSVLFPQSALERFAADGRFYNFPLSWTKPLSFSDRQKVFEVIKTHASGENPKIRVMHDSNIDLEDKCMMVDIFERYMSIAGSMEGDSDHYSGEYSIFIKNTNIISDFRFYIDFIKRNRIHLSPDLAVSYIDSLMLECERNKQ